MGEQSIDMQGEDIRGEGGRERHLEIMIQEQRAKAVVTWAIAGRVKSGSYRHVVSG